MFHIINWSNDGNQLPHFIIFFFRIFFKHTPFLHADFKTDFYLHS